MHCFNTDNHVVEIDMHVYPIVSIQIGRNSKSRVQVCQTLKSPHALSRFCSRKKLSTFSLTVPFLYSKSEFSIYFQA